MGRVWIRLYTVPTLVTNTHAFIVGSESGGLSERLASFLINDEITTFRDIRQMIETSNEGGMNRRTMLFQELHHVMMTSSNPHAYKKTQLHEYRFGVLSGVGGIEEGDRNVTRDYDKTAVPSLFSLELEEEPIAQIMGNLLEYDLLVVPISQVRPKDELVSINVYEEVVLTEKEQAKQDVEAINSINLEKYNSGALAEVNAEAKQNRNELFKEVLT